MEFLERIGTWGLVAVLFVFVAFVTFCGGIFVLAAFKTSLFMGALAIVCLAGLLSLFTSDD
jgi:hypothetical protein